MDDVVKAALVDAPVVRIKIPRSHPKAAAFTRLVRALSTRQVLPSGLEVPGEGLRCKTDPAVEFLQVLQREFGVDVDAVVAELRKVNPKLTPESLMSFAPSIIPALLKRG